MIQKIISTKEDVREFITDLKSVLNNPEFDVKRDLDILLKKKTESPIDPFTTGNTMLALDYDKNNVCEQLKSLELTEYVETIIDDKDSTLPPFFTFVKSIESRDVYIKAKIRDKQNCKVFCVSFHFARFPFTEHLPYE